MSVNCGLQHRKSEGNKQGNFHCRAPDAQRQEEVEITHKHNTVSSVINFCQLPLFLCKHNSEIGGCVFYLGHRVWERERKVLLSCVKSWLAGGCRGWDDSHRRKWVEQLGLWKDIRRWGQNYTVSSPSHLHLTKEPAPGQDSSPKDTPQKEKIVDGNLWHITHFMSLSHWVRSQQAFKDLPFYLSYVLSTAQGYREGQWQKKWYKDDDSYCTFYDRKSDITKSKE